MVAALAAAWLVVMAGSWAADGPKGEPLFSTWWPAVASYPLTVTMLAVGLFFMASAWLYHNR